MNYNCIQRIQSIIALYTTLHSRNQSIIALKDEFQKKKRKYYGDILLYKGEENESNILFSYLI